MLKTSSYFFAQHAFVCCDIRELSVQNTFLANTGLIITTICKFFEMEIQLSQKLQKKLECLLKSQFLVIFCPFFLWFLSFGQYDSKKFPK